MATFTKLKSGSWGTQVRRKGKYASETFLRPKDAEQWALEVERRIDRGEPAIPAKEGELKTFGDLVRQHREDLREVGRRIGRSKAASLTFLENRLGRLRLPEFDRERLIHFGKDRAREGAGPVTVGIDIGCINYIMPSSRTANDPAGTTLAEPISRVADAAGTHLGRTEFPFGRLMNRQSKAVKISTIALVTLALSLQAGPGFAQNQRPGGGSAGAPAGGADQSGGGSTGAAGAGNADQGANGAGGQQLRPPQGRPGAGQKQPQGQQSQGKSNSQGGGSRGQAGQGEGGQGGTNQNQLRKGQNGQGGQRQEQTNQGEPRKGEKGQGQHRQDQTNQGEPQKNGTGQGNANEGGTRKTTGQQGQGRQGQQRVTIKTEQQTRIRDTVRTLNVRPVTNLNVRIAVGVAIPRAVRLRPLPPAIIEIVPELRDFRYVLVPGRILIVDPATLEVVEIIEI